MRAALAPQDVLYTVLQRGPDGDRARIIGSVLDVVTVPNDPDGAMRRLTDPDIRIVSLTVTEKAYCQDAATGTLDEYHPGITADLRQRRFPPTVPGLLAEAFRRRRDTGAGGVHCAGLRQSAEQRRNRGAHRWPLCRAARPGARRMDRQRDRLPLHHGRSHCSCNDTSRIARWWRGWAMRMSWPVVAEPFSQWIIEDRFVRGRPAWEEAGAEIVRDVRPYELMKLRALNGAHSSARLSRRAFAGLETVADAIADPVFPPFLRALWDDDLVPTIPTVPGMDLPGYTAELVRRFSNPGIRHRLLQIAMDGSQKLPQRLLRPALDRLGQGVMPRRIALVVAAWMRFLQSRDEQGRAYEINDPLAGRLVRLAADAGENAKILAAALFDVREVFDPVLAGHAGFHQEVVRHLRSLLVRGVRATLADMTGRNALRAALERDRFRTSHSDANRKASFCEQKEAKNFVYSGPAGFAVTGQESEDVFCAAFFQKSGCFPGST